MGSEKTPSGFRTKLQRKGFKARVSQVFATERQAAAAHDGFKRELELLQIEQAQAQQPPLRRAKAKLKLNFPNARETRWDEVQGRRAQRDQPCPHCGGSCPVYSELGRKKPFRLRGKGGRTAFATAEEACAAAHKSAPAAAAGKKLTVAVV